MPAKKKAKRKYAPKPSTLLLRALTLLDHGKAWIKEAFKRPAGEEVYFEAGATTIERVLTKESYCAIGAYNKINTPNEAEVIRFLATVIKPDDAAEIGTDHGYRTKKDKKRGYEGIVTDFNDDSSTTFSQISAAFRRASRLALKEGR